MFGRKKGQKEINKLRENRLKEKNDERRRRKRQKKKEVTGGQKRRNKKRKCSLLSLFLLLLKPQTFTTKTDTPTFPEFHHLVL